MPINAKPEKRIEKRTVSAAAPVDAAAGSEVPAPIKNDTKGA